MKSKNTSFDKNKSLYISGIIKMAFNCSTKIGLSYMDADCFKKGDIVDIINNNYDISKDKITIHEVNITLENLFKDILGDEKRIINSLMHLLEMDLGKAIRVYTIDDDSEIPELLSAPNGKTSFYFVKEIYIVEFEEDIVVFIIGNDE